MGEGFPPLLGCLSEDFPDFPIPNVFCCVWVSELVWWLFFLGFFDFVGPGYEEVFYSCDFVSVSLFEGVFGFEAGCLDGFSCLWFGDVLEG